MGIKHQNRRWLSVKKSSYSVPVIPLCLGLAAIQPTAEAITFTPLISYGQVRPDAAEPNTTDYFFGVHCAVLDGDDIAFRAMSDGFREGFDSIWTMKTNGTGLRKLVGKNTKVPSGVGKFKAVGFNNGGDFTTSPFLRNGRVVFFGFDSNPDLNLFGVGGVYSVRLNDGVLKRVANYSTTNPSDLTAEDGLEKFTGFIGDGGSLCHSRYTFDGDKVFFAAQSTNSDGVYQADFNGVGLKKVRDDKDVDYPEVPDVGDTKLPIANYFGPALGINSVSKQRLFGYIGASVLGVKKIYVNGTPWFSRINPLPGDLSPTGESFFTALQFDGRKLLFKAGDGDYFGIFSKLGKTAQVRRIVSNLTKLPGMSQCPIDNIGSFAADAGRVFFFAHTTNCDGQTANGRSGIFMHKDGKIQRIVSTGKDLGNGAIVQWVENLLGVGSAQAGKLLFTVRTTTSLETLYLVDLGA